MSKKLLLISDTHFSKNNALLFGYVDVEKNIGSLLKEMQNEKPDYILVLGDISQDGTVESYIRAKEFLLQFSCDKYIIMGNHDTFNINNMLSNEIVMKDHLDIDNHRFIFISSYKGNGADDGFVQKSELDKASELFDKNKFNYLLVHHHFIKTDGIIDTYIMENHLEFCNTISNLPFQAIFHGHVHNSYNTILSGINVHAAPSTCIQFALTKQLQLEPIIGFQTIILKNSSYEHKIFSKTI